MPYQSTNKSGNSIGRTDQN